MVIVFENDARIPPMDNVIRKPFTVFFNDSFDLIWMNSGMDNISKINNREYSMRICSFVKLKCFVQSMHYYV